MPLRSDSQTDPPRCYEGLAFLYTGFRTLKFGFNEPKQNPENDIETGELFAGRPASRCRGKAYR